MSTELKPAPGPAKPAPGPSNGHNRLPPGPRLPATVQAFGWSRRPLPFMEGCQRQYGDIFTLRIRHAGTWVVLCDPEDVRRVFTADPATLGSSMANTLLEPLLGRRSVVILDEPDHMPRRKVMLRKLHGRGAEQYGELILEVARGEARSWPVGEPLQLWPRMQAISLEVIMRIVFGEVDSDPLRRLRALMARQTEWLNDSRRLTALALLGPRWLAGSRGFREMLAPVRAPVVEAVHRRRAAGVGVEGEDVVAMLEQARDEDGSPLSEEDVRDELVTLITDGPTATLLSWVFERLLRHPETLARLRAAVLAGEEETYVDAVMRETMRLCPLGADRRAAAGRADGAGRVHDPCGHAGRPLHPPRAPPRGGVPPPALLPARAFPGAPRGRVHVDPLRRRYAPLPGGDVRAVGDEARDPGGARRGGARRRRRPRRAAAPQRDRLQPQPGRPGVRHPPPGPAMLDLIAVPTASSAWLHW